MELRFDYRGERLQLEPYRLVSWQRRWFVVGPRPADRHLGAVPAGLDAAAHARRPPVHAAAAARRDYTSFVLREVAFSGWHVHARIAVDAPAEDVLARINPTVGVVESVDADHCVLVTGGDSVEIIAVYIGMLGLDFHVTEPPELVEAVATGRASGTGGPSHRLLELQLPAHDPVADRFVDADHVVVRLGVPGVDRGQLGLHLAQPAGSCRS